MHVNYTCTVNAEVLRGASKLSKSLLTTRDGRKVVKVRLESHVVAYTHESPRGARNVCNNYFNASVSFGKLHKDRVEQGRTITRTTFHETPPSRRHYFIVMLICDPASLQSADPRNNGHGQESCIWCFVMPRRSPIISCRTRKGPGVYSRTNFRFE